CLPRYNWVPESGNAIFVPFTFLKPPQEDSAAAPPYTFAQRLRRAGLVLWIFGEHTLFIGVFWGGVFVLGEILARLGYGDKLLPIPFFPHPVPLDDALFLLDFVIVVLFYYIAIKEIAELYRIRFGSSFARRKQ